MVIFGGGGGDRPELDLLLLLRYDYENHDDGDAAGTGGGNLIDEMMKTMRLVRVMMVVAGVFRDSSSSIHAPSANNSSILSLSSLLASLPSSQVWG